MANALALTAGIVDPVAKLAVIPNISGPAYTRTASGRLRTMSLNMDVTVRATIY